MRASSILRARMGHMFIGGDGRSTEYNIECYEGSVPKNAFALQSAPPKAIPSLYLSNSFSLYDVHVY